eukprot:TRINITY_DN18713_c0_g1_i1.p1 TRINITY_DN18713_c0_g1~~TRINITY_DN18713_c0_g1_i1.p1  ORF type:complete len:366 (-),score=64.57 TRINITY_DN18713_c0_g1_i1:69-1166(-)
MAARYDRKEVVERLAKLTREITTRQERFVYAHEENDELAKKLDKLYEMKCKLVSKLWRAVKDTLDHDKEVAHQKYESSKDGLEKIREEIDHVSLVIEKNQEVKTYKIESNNKLPEVIQELEKEKRNLLKVLHTPDYIERYPMHYAVATNDTRCLENLPEEKIIEAINTPDETNKTAFERSVEENSDQAPVLRELSNISPEKLAELKKKKESEYQYEEKNGGVTEERRSSHVKMLKLLDPGTRYDHLWKEEKKKDSLVVIFQDYCAPVALKGFVWPFLKRLLTGHWNRHHLELAKEIASAFRIIKNESSINSELVKGTIEGQLGEGERLAEWMSKVGVKYGSMWWRITYVLRKFGVEKLLFSPESK